MFLQISDEPVNEALVMFWPSNRTNVVGDRMVVFMYYVALLKPQVFLSDLPPNHNLFQTRHSISQLCAEHK